jgi:hypothetical protein
MSRWKKLFIHVLGITSITLVSLCAVSQAKQLSSTHKWLLVFTILIGASFIFESILSVRRRLVTHYKIFSLVTGLCLLSMISLDSSLNSYVYFLASMSLCLFAVKAAHVQFVLHSFELCPASSRYQLEINCSIKSKKVEDMEAKIIDISNTGCLVDSNKNLEPGDLVYLDIFLKEKMVKTSARVIRYSKNPNGYGLQFVGLDRRKYNTFDEALKDILVDSGTIPYAA